MQRMSILRLCFLLVLCFCGSVPLAKAEEGWLAGRSIGETFGVQVKGLTTTPRELDSIKAAGFGLLRYGIGWSYVEQKRGAYKWEEFDAFIKQVRAQKLRSIIFLTGGHPAYSGAVDAPRDAKNLNHIEKLILAPANTVAVEGFAQFAAAAVQRYNGDDIIWEIWNEPDLDYFWPPKADPEAYATLAGAACSAMRQAAPSAKIAGPAAASMPGWKDRLGFGLIATVLRSSVSSCIDAISFHSYRVERNSPPKSPESVTRNNESAAAFVASRAPAAPRRFILPLICSEWGYNTLELGKKQQADYVLRTHLSNLLSGVAVTIWYEWRDSMQGADDPEAHYGLIDYDGKDKPAIEAVRNVLPLISNDRVERRLPTTNDRDYVVLLRGGDDSRKLVFWTTRLTGSAEAFLRVSGQDKAIRMTSAPQVIDAGKVVPQVSVTARLVQ
jgi:hypothetical protein